MVAIELGYPRKKAKPPEKTTQPPPDPPDQVLTEMEPHYKTYLRVEFLEEPSTPLTPPDEPPLPIPKLPGF